MDNQGFRSQEVLEDEKELIFDRFIRQQRFLYEDEVVKVLTWFRDKFPKRHLKWTDGMGTGFWVIDGEILDIDDVWRYNGSGYTVKSVDEWPLKLKILKPLVDFQLSIENTDNTMPYGIGIGDWRIDRVSRVIVQG